MFSSKDGTCYRKKKQRSNPFGFGPFLEGDEEKHRPPFWKLIMCVQFNNYHLEDTG